MDVGQWSARPHAEIQERWPDDYQRVRAGDWQARAGGGETRREVRLRVQDVLERVQREADGQRVAVVTHLGVLRSLVPGIQVGNAECVELAWHEVLGAGAPEAVVGEGPL
jgi:broad specificity phosphatase PhoE